MRRFHHEQRRARLVLKARLIPNNPDLVLCECLDVDRLSDGFVCVAVKTKPPSRVQALSQEGFATTLLITWTHPIPEEYLRLIYEIRFCAAGSPDWHHVSVLWYRRKLLVFEILSRRCVCGFASPQVPLEDTAKSIQSFRLQNLKPDTLYTIEVRCQYFSEGQYWSNWSHNVTKRTPEARECWEGIILMLFTKKKGAFFC